MNFTIDDLLYGYLQYLATFNPHKKCLYLWKKTFIKNRRTIGTALGMTTQKINRHLEKLKENNLISEDKENYYFPYDENGKYKLVNYDMLEYLITTRNCNAIKIYIYLLNKYHWKKEYVFTLNEIQTAIGYSKDSKNRLASTIVKNNLNSFCREGIMNISIIQDTMIGKDNTIIPVYRYQLNFVSEEPPVDYERIDVVKYNNGKCIEAFSIPDTEEKADTFKF